MGAWITESGHAHGKRQSQNHDGGEVGSAKDLVSVHPSPLPQGGSHGKLESQALGPVRDGSLGLLALTLGPVHSTHGLSRLLTQR